MVAFAKPHPKVHTPDRSAKDSGHRFYSPEISRWLNRDPIGERGSVNIYSLANNNAVNHRDVLGLYFWGSPGTYDATPTLYIQATFWSETTLQTNVVINYDILPATNPNGPWMSIRPGEDDNCFDEPATLAWSRTDVVYSWFASQINMKVDLSFSGGGHRELVLSWFTCVRPDNTAGYVPYCRNKTTCTIPGFVGQGVGGWYQTYAQVAYQSCEGCKWKTKTDIRMRKYKPSFPGWTWEDL